MAEASGEMQRDRVREAILTAASELIAEGGAAALTTRRVAVRAGVQAPTIYRLFKDKQGLVRAVAGYVLDTYARSKNVAEDDDDPVAALTVAWQAHIDFGLANAGLYLLMNDSAYGEGVAERAQSPGFSDALALRVRAIAAAGVLQVSEARAVNLIRAAGDGVIRALLNAPRDATHVPPLADDMLSSVLAVIVASRPEAAPRSVDGLLVQLHAVADDIPGLSTGEQTLLREWASRSIDAAEQQHPVRSP